MERKSYNGITSREFPLIGKNSSYYEKKCLNSTKLDRNRWQNEMLDKLAFIDNISKYYVDTIVILL